jgi:hypothetical protein
MSSVTAPTATLPQARDNRNDNTRWIGRTVI